MVEPVVGTDGKMLPFVSLCLTRSYFSFGLIHAVYSCSGTEKPTVVTKMNLTLSADHRVFDGHVGSK